MTFISRKKILGVALFTLFIAGCSLLPEKKSTDPFERLPEEASETLEGRVFPFSVSVATSATHRLEKEGKLVSYLASDIVRLEEFEGQEVEVSGVFRSEKMRPIFWVESATLPEKNIAPVLPDIERFETKKFTFQFPSLWEYSTAPNGTAYFLEKSDPARRVFLTFSVEDLEKSDDEVEPNTLIANLAGTKEISQDKLGRDRETVVLFSNVFKKKYTFVFTHHFEEFEKKKAFFKLLNSFVEGEENVLAEKEKQLKDQADQVSQQLLASKPSQDEPVEETSEETAEPKPKVEAPEPKQEKEEPGLLKKIFGSEESIDPSFVNLIDEKAFLYTSAYYDLSMRVPFGFWFRNFGPSENAIARIGFSDEAISDSANVKFWLEILGDETPPTEFSEKLVGEKIMIQWPRSDKSFFRFSGPQAFRDAMRSVQGTVVNVK